ncbi:hypothetical protein HIM_07127 [Hirsutella minnesotensis 3608]|uniref:Uncharacterized protein n=1 Tax=Hirsutella minnesotensis 3608 TaxID=1043627 RepID=A0A0F7ZIB1_9HYPO|nr:hypothetical protein HIM_07127 [Hirsutella minnesotensis 3608]
MAGVQPGQQLPSSFPNPTPGASWQPPATDSPASRASEAQFDGAAYNGTQSNLPPPPVRSSSATSAAQVSSRDSSLGPASGFQTTPLLSNGHISTGPSGANTARSSPQMQAQAQQAHTFATLAKTAKDPLRSPRATTASLEETPEYLALATAMSKTPPNIVRQLVRDTWELCLLGSDYHTAFLTYTAFSRASPAALDRAFKDFGTIMVDAAKRPMVEHLSKSDYDELADTILAKVSNDFLDKAMARRLETIRARELVNALARAERLGYDVQDIVEEKSVNGVEHVVPSLGQIAGLHIPPQPSTTNGYQPPAPLPMAQRQPASTPGTPPASEEQAGIVRCAKCSRPCSGPSALRYHTARTACYHTHKLDRINKDICPHCGCQFTSGTGLMYHVKSYVCGRFDSEIERTVLTMLADMYPRLSPPTMPPAGSSATTQQTPQHTTQYATPTQAFASSTPKGSVTWATPSRNTPQPSEDPYAKLAPEARRNFEAEMKQAEEKYGGLMRDAMKMPPEKREEELARLKNSYNTKQSVTRKKYGIRLRERRSKAEIEQEKLRLFGTLGGSSAASDGPALKKPRLSSSQSGSTSTGQQAQYTPVPIPAIPSSGLAGTSGLAEHTDPTTLLTPSQPRSVAHAQARAQAQAQAQASHSKGTSDDPMQIDGSSGSAGTDSDSDDNDIPAKVPGA